MADNLHIEITGELNISQTSKEINNQLKTITQHIDKLNLNVNIDTSSFREISSQIKQIQNQLNINKELKIFNGDEARKWYVDVNHAVKEYEKLGSIKLDKNIDAATGKLKDFTLNINKSNGELEKVKFSLVKISDGSIAYQEVSKKLIDNSQALREKELQFTQKTNTALQKRNQLEMDYVNKFLNKRGQQALNIGVKLNNLSPENTRLLEHQLERYKRIITEFQKKNELGLKIDDSQLTKIQNIENRIKRLYDTVRINSKDLNGFDFSKYERLDTILRQTANANEYLNKSLIQGKTLLDANVQSTDQFIKVSQRLRDGSNVQNLSVYINKATGETYKLSESMQNLYTRTYDVGSAFKTAFEKIGLWAGATGIFYGTITALRTLSETIVDIDTKLTELSKVMSTDTNFTQLMQDTVSLANTYGRSLTEAQDALVEFGKAGYEAEQALQLTNATLLGANVTGLKTGQMAEYLTGALIQFNLTAEDSTRVIDKLNEVDNNFSVTSLGLAQSIAKAGESAQQFGWFDNLAA